MLSKRLMQGVLKKQIEQIITICFMYPEYSWSPSTSLKIRIAGGDFRHFKLFSVVFEVASCIGCDNTMKAQNSSEELGCKE